MEKRKKISTLKSISAGTVEALCIANNVPYIKDDIELSIFNLVLKFDNMNVSMQKFSQNIASNTTIKRIFTAIGYAKINNVIYDIANRLIDLGYNLKSFEEVKSILANEPYDKFKDICAKGTFSEIKTPKSRKDLGLSRLNERIQDRARINIKFHDQPELLKLRKELVFGKLKEEYYNVIAKIRSTHNISETSPHIASVNKSTTSNSKAIYYYTQVLIKFNNMYPANKIDLLDKYSVNKFKRKRVELGYTQEDLAKILHVSQSYISQFEKLLPAHVAIIIKSYKDKNAIKELSKEIPMSRSVCEYLGIEPENSKLENAISDEPNKSEVVNMLDTPEKMFNHLVADRKNVDEKMARENYSMSKVTFLENNGNNIVLNKPPIIESNNNLISNNWLTTAELAQNTQHTVSKYPYELSIMSKLQYFMSKFNILLDIKFIYSNMNNYNLIIPYIGFLDMHEVALDTIMSKNNSYELINEIKIAISTQNGNSIISLL